MEKWEGGWLEAEDHNLGAVFQSTLGCEERIGAAFPQNDSQFSRPCIPAALSKRVTDRRRDPTSAFFFGTSNPRDKYWG